MASALANKLNLKAGMKVQIVGKPSGVALTGIETTTSTEADGVIVFVKKKAEVDKTCAPAIAAAKDDRIAWIVYPKAGQLDTDLNRDILWKHLLKKNIQGVGQIALDTVWSAMRFRPKK